MMKVKRGKSISNTVSFPSGLELETPSLVPVKKNASAVVVSDKYNLKPIPLKRQRYRHILGSEWSGCVALREKEGASLVLTVPFLTVLQLPQEMLPLRQRRNTNHSTQHPMPPKRSK